MADNVISKIVRLIFDKSSGAQVSKDAKKELSKVDDALGSLGDKAKQLLGALAAVFAVKKIIDFGKAAVAAAIESEKAWSSLDATITATGVNFKAMEKDIRASADAFAAATIHDDDSYAESLQRLIVLTGDVSASTNNMGLVANVAAQFFEGDLAPATELVSKVMNGNIAMLGKMGIHARDAQHALEILAQRSMGAAEKAAGTFGGRLKQINNLWGEFKEEVGFAIIKSEGGTQAITAVKGALIAMAEWVAKNKDEIGDWVINGVNFAIEAVDVMYRGVYGMAKLFQGTFYYSLGIAVDGLAGLTRAYGRATRAWSDFMKPFNDKGAWEQYIKSNQIIDAAQALDDWAAAAKKAGLEASHVGLETLATPVFTPVKFPDAKLPVKDPMIAQKQGDLDTLSKMDEDYWKKRIKLTQNSNDLLRTIERQTSHKLYQEFSARQQAAAAAASELIGMVAAGVGPSAAIKAKQNLIESAELAVRAGIAALNPFTHWQIPGLLTGAARHAGIASAWKALSLAAGGDGGHGGGSPGGVSAVSASSGSAARAESSGIIVNVHFDPFDPNSPKTQSSIALANQNIKERYGDNSRVTFVPSQ